MRNKILLMIKAQIESIENKAGRVKFIVDTIDIIALKELYNEILKLDE